MTIISPTKAPTSLALSSDFSKQLRFVLAAVETTTGHIVFMCQMNHQILMGGGLRSLRLQVGVFDPTIHRSHHADALHFQMFTVKT